MANGPREPSQGDFYDKAFETYALAIGFMIREWNDLQEQLRLLFSTIIALPNEELSKAIWHAIPVDRFQRAMLRDTARIIFDPVGLRKTEAQQKADAALLEEIEWIIEKADSTGRLRDDAAHAPLSLLLDWEENWEGGTLDFVAKAFIAHQHGGHPIAVKLKGKELIAEFTYYRERMLALRKYTQEIDLYLSHGREWTFPQRPTLPAPPQKIVDGA